MKVWDLASKGGSKLSASGPVAAISDGAMDHRQGLEARYKFALARWTPLMRKLAFSPPPGMDFDDVFQEASIALLKVVLVGDQARGGEDALAQRVLQNTVVGLFRRVVAPGRMPKSPDGSGASAPPVHLSTVNPGVVDEDALCPEGQAILQEELDIALARCEAVRSDLNRMDRGVLGGLLGDNAGQKASGLTRGSHYRSLRRIRGRFGRAKR